MKKHKEAADLPELAQLEKELDRVKYQRSFGLSLRSTVGGLITVAAIAVLVATLLLPVLQIYGSSMTPTLSEGNIVVSLKGEQFQQGDIIAFYYNNKILVKRVIAFPGDWVDMTPDGTVFINGRKIDEPYVVEKAFGDCTISLPYQVPDGKYFVMGDHRSVSQDSRSDMIGCVAGEQVVGKIVFKVWPLSGFGKVE